MRSWDFDTAGIVIAGLFAFVIGILVGWRITVLSPPPVPGTIEIEAEDELCGPQVFVGSDGQLKAQIWRGDPDTCRPLEN